jgi:hypothetical protein
MKAEYEGYAGGVLILKKKKEEEDECCWPVCRSQV